MSRGKGCVGSGAKAEGIPAASRLLIFGERGRIRTCDPCLKRALLYQLSYAPNAFKSNTLLDFAQSTHLRRIQTDLFQN